MRFTLPLIVITLTSALLFVRNSSVQGAATHPTPTTSPAAARSTVGGWLGVRVQPNEDGPGAVVINVTDGSPAAAARIKPEDVILSVDNHETRTVDALVRFMQQTHPGQRVQFTLGDGTNPDHTVTASQTVMVTLGQRPAAVPPSTQPGHVR